MNPLMEYKAKDKYGSMMRAYERLKRISINNGNSISNADARDSAEEFFNQCYHFKDWLKRDARIMLTEDVEKYISASGPLSLAADFCNSLKHGGLDKSSRSGKNLEMINTHMKVDITPTGIVASSQLELTISGGKYNAFELATACVREWDRFLEENRVTISHP
jgi:hypothetical protein